jgi:hypothetical protein
MSKKSKNPIHIPEWIAVLYTVSAIILVPWVIFLAKDLPTHHVVTHYDAAWVGLDIAIMVTLLITGFLASRKSPFLVLSASTIGTLLIVDAWFDVVSARPGSEFFQAILLALCIELPLAIGSYYLAYRVLLFNLKK